MAQLLSSLNEAQKEAVTTGLGPVLVLAGAGSGKTRVLTFRVVYLLSERKFSPQDLLVLTFTNKAAGEMKERIRKLIEKGLGEKSAITMGTFHSVCARLLRTEIENLKRGYDKYFVIYDTDDQMRVLQQIILELGLQEHFRPQVFAYYISQAKNRLVEPADLGLDQYLENSLTKVYDLYQKRLREQNALDFDDLLQLTCELFSTKPRILKKYQERFKYILVDEYQDTNHAQYVMLNRLAAGHENLFVVGDDAQSIYGFRGANMQNILDFQNDYPKAKIIKLEQNYRSSQPILDVASEVIKLNPARYEKKLWTENRVGEKVGLYEARDEVDEAEFVIKRIVNGEYRMEEDAKEIIYEEDTPILDRFMRQRSRLHSRFSILNSKFQIPKNLKDFVILYRTHAQSRPFEEVLLSAGVPYQIVGGIKFYERKEIKDILSYLRLVQNPRDLVSLSRIINVPARGVGQVNFREINKVLPKYKYNYERVFNNLDDLPLTSRALGGVKEFFRIFIDADDLPEQENLVNLLHFILSRSGYKESLSKLGEEGQTRLENIEELFNVAAKYKRSPWVEGLSAFLEEVALMTDLDRADDQGNKLTLMTLHSAKGLEFDNVFFVGLEEGLLPHSRSLLSPAEIAEEIRLAYVGITRAKRYLYL
ncbi:MAG: UvrD-helicase domain-containing protein, partial [Candidatus Doudnabacteria bacterium]|nr:UvrD-helicase domain-containing protein [Candidatus Doudnabacteria bacterium]